MTRTLAPILCLLLVCAGLVAPERGVARELGLEDFSKIVVGKTRKEEVIAILGAPSRAGRLRTEERETWEYKYGSGRSFWVEFGPDGIVALTNVTVDMNSSRYGGP